MEHAFKEIDTLQQVRVQMHAELGREFIRHAHRQRRWLDVLSVAVPMAVLLGNLLVLATNSLPWWGLVAIVLVQGVFLQLLPLVAHDLFVHRQVWPNLVGKICATVCFGLVTLSYTVYRLGHHRHHAKIGTSEDTEAGLADVNTSVRRVMFSTLIGYKLVKSGRWGNAGKYNGYHMLIGANEDDHRSIAAEKRCIIAIFTGFLLWGLLVSWQSLLYGFLIPLIVVAPILNAFRIIIEHAVVDPENPYSLATAYKCGPVAHIIFLAGAGDCHLLHHVFPRLPWYNLPGVVSQAWPILEKCNIQKRTSFYRLLVGWYVHAYPHRSHWPDERSRTNP